MHFKGSWFDKFSIEIGMCACHLRVCGFEVLARYLEEVKDLLVEYLNHDVRNALCLAYHE